MSQHPPDHPTSQLRAAVRTFYLWIGSMVLLGLAPLAANRLIDAGTPMTRAAAVLVGAGSALPWMVVVAAMIRRGDEFTRRLHLVALAWAFGVAMFTVVTLAWLVRADLMAPPDLLVLWLGLLVIWFLAIVMTKRHYEREP